MTRKRILAEIDELNSKINNLYWTFTRSKRGRPPVMVAPQLYARRRELREMLAARRARIR